MSLIPQDSAELKKIFVAFLAGAIFSVGLAISGMTLPHKVIGFLDVTGDWDPTLAFVMGGAVVVYAISHFFVVGRMRKPVVHNRFHIPTRRDITGRLLIGSALFGIGWGLSGFCPGPALASAAAGLAGMTDIVIFLVALIAGMYGLKGFEALLARAKQTQSGDSSVQT